MAMNTFQASVDGPSLWLENDIFYAPVEVYAQPAYGRFLFTTHNVVIQNCMFVGGRDDVLLSFIGPIQGAIVQNCHFSLK